MSDVTTPNPDADGLVGAVTAYAGETLPGPKYRWCHGTQTVSRTEFSLLFSRLGVSWGTGDGSTTFTLPNLDKRVLVGLDSTAADTDFDLVGGLGGTKTATMPTHGHGMTGAPGVGTLAISAASTGHTHTVTLPTAASQSGTGFTATQSSGVTTSGPTGTTTAVTGAPAIGTLAVSNATGSGDNMPPFATVRYIIKIS